MFQTAATIISMTEKIVLMVAKIVLIAVNIVSMTEKIVLMVANIVLTI